MSQGEKHPSREELAQVEVGQTEITRTLAWMMTGFFLTVIFSVPLAQFAHERRLPPTSSAAASPAPSLQRFTLPPSFDLTPLFPTRKEIASLLNARNCQQAFHVFTQVNARLRSAIQQYETGLETRSLVGGWILPPMESLLIGRLRAGNEKAYCGIGDWLYYRPDIDYVTGKGFLDPQILQERSLKRTETEGAPQPDPVRGIVSFRDQLKRRGIELVVIPAPSKATIYPEMFSSRFANQTEPLENPAFAEFKKRLQDEHIAVFDVSPSLVRAKQTSQQPLYLKTDTHWSPAGMELAARELASFLRAHNLMPPASGVKYGRQSQTIQALGDIALMLKLPHNQQFYRTETVQVHPVTDPAGNPWSPQAASDVLVLGDSFLNIFSLGPMGWGQSAGFVEQLSYELQHSLDAILINDNGSYATRRQLSRDIQHGNDRLAGKRLVIYEFAARELMAGDWKTDLSLKSTGVPTPESGTPIPERITVTGTIEQLGRVPRPGTVPYKDCLMAIHLKGVKPLDSGAPLAGEAVVFVWGMRDNKLERAIGYTPGQEVRLTLVPWERVEKQYGNYNRAELDDERLMDLPTYWAETQAAFAATAPASDKRTPEPMRKLESEMSVIPRDIVTPTPTLSVAASGTGKQADLAMEDFAAKAAHLESENKSVLRGQDGWLFFAPELRSLSVGRFWGEDAKRVSRSANPQNADPLPAILDFNAQVKSAGAALLLVPIPAKAIIYADKVSDLVKVGPDGKLPRVDHVLQEFYQTLRKSGVNVLDLTDEMIAHRDGPEGPMYCRQDTHFSPRAAKFIANRIKATIADQPWLAAVTKNSYAVKEQQLTLNGDLWASLGDAALPRECVTIEVVTDENNAPVQPWRESPVLLLGDSHNLIYSVGEDMQATGAGLPDHLAKVLGFPVDLVGIRGSGATPARVSLLRRRDKLAGKKLIIWCFTVREFTEDVGGWAKIPIVTGF